MSPCRKNVLVVFGALAVAAAVLVPYRERLVNSSQKRGSVLVRRETFESRGYMVLPSFLKRRGSSVSPKEGSERRISLDTRLFLGQLAAVGGLGLLDFFLVCGWRRKRPAP